MSKISALICSLRGMASKQGGCSGEIMKLAADTIEVLSSKTTSQNGDEWIPVGDRLPEEHEEYNDVVDPLTLAVVDTELHKVSELVLVTVYDSNKDKTFVTDDCTVDGKWANYDDWFDVLAWKPLPPTYEPEVE